MEQTNRALTAVPAEEGVTLSVVGDTYRLVITGGQTEGAYAVIDMLIPPGGGPGPHAHVAFREAFYVLDGQVEVKTEGRNYTAVKGSFINIPLGGLVHCFKNETDKIAHLLCTVVPAGLEDLFKEIGKPVSPGSFLPPPDLQPVDVKKLKEIAEKHGQKVYRPDYLG